MRIPILMTTVALALPLAVGAQVARRPVNVERFEVSKLPTTPANDLEREIFAMLRQHKKGDLVDASRIHAKLGAYYKDRGEPVLADNCNRMAVDAWAAASGERPASAGAPGSPPFEGGTLISRGFSFTDQDLKVEHTWDFYDDGTWSHVITALSDPDTPGPRETGWYHITPGRIRLWQMKPRADKQLSFDMLGDGGKDGVILDGVKMVPLK
jgi:hypothetical protein